MTWRQKIEPRPLPDPRLEQPVDPVESQAPKGCLCSVKSGDVSMWVMLFHFLRGPENRLRFFFLFWLSFKTGRNHMVPSKKGHQVPWALGVAGASEVPRETRFAPSSRATGRVRRRRKGHPWICFATGQVFIVKRLLETYFSNTNSSNLPTFQEPYHRGRKCTFRSKPRMVRLVLDKLGVRPSCLFGKPGSKQPSPGNDPGCLDKNRQKPGARGSNRLTLPNTQVYLNYG